MPVGIGGVYWGGLAKGRGVRGTDAEGRYGALKAHVVCALKYKHPVIIQETVRNRRETKGLAI